MEVRNVFLISIYAVMALSSLILALSEQAFLPQCVTFILLVFAYRFTDREGVFALSVGWAEFAATAGFFLAGTELVVGELSENIEARLVSGAHLLVYLLWVIMFLPKRERHFWWICALSTLQVAVSAVLTRDGWFGLILFAYFFLMIWTLSVFSLYRAKMLFETSDESGGARPIDVGPEPPPVRPKPRRGGRAPVLRLSGRPTAVASAIQIDAHESWVTGRFLAGTLITALASIVIGSFFFITIPRVWIGRAPFSTDDEATEPLTGFDAKVTLGGMGNILESTEPVMEVRLFRGSQELDVETYALEAGFEEPLFRGQVLAVYSNANWELGSYGEGRPKYLSSDPELRHRQQIRLEPTGTPILFAIPQVGACRIVPGNDEVRMQRSTGILTIADGKPPSKRITYVAAMSVPAGKGSAPQTPLTSRHRRICTMFPAERLPRLAELARQKADVENAASETEIARNLESYLRDSGEFGYTLALEPTPPGIDPVEDFLLRRKQGHCEYFASALALMLRSVGIPSRLVTGFKGGTRNSITGHFEVQQRHAHAWVEAYVDERWIALDGTPAERAASVDSLSPRIRTWADFKRVIAELWSSQVVEINLRQQYDTLYFPLQKTVVGFWDSMKGNRSKARSFWQNVWDFLSSPERWFSWQGGLVTFVLLLLLVGLVWLFRRLKTLWKALRKRWARDAQARRSRVEFYERFREICARHDLRRAPQETHREFGSRVTLQLADRLDVAGLHEFPQRLVEDFHSIRFGHRSAEGQEVSLLNRELTRFADCLAENGRPG